VIELTHFLRVTHGQIIVYGYQVCTSAGKSIQVKRKSCCKGFPFPGFHFRNLTLVKNNTTHDLNIEVPHVHNPAARFTNNRKCIRKNIVGSSATILKLVFENSSLSF